MTDDFSAVLFFADNSYFLLAHPEKKEIVGLRGHILMDKKDKKQP